MFPCTRRLQAISVIVFFAALSCLHAQWQALNKPFRADIYSLAEHNGTVFAMSGTGLYRSADGGKTWDHSNPASDFRKFTRLGSTLYAAAGTGVFTSDDDGRSWQPLQSNIPNSWGISGITTQGSTLLLSWMGDGISVSTDGGATWEAENDGLPSTHINSLVSAGTDVYALLSSNVATPDAGVFMRKPGGGWTKAGSENVEGQNLTIVDSTLFVWGWNKALRSEDKGKTWQPLTPLDSSLLSTFSCLAGTGTTLFASTNTKGLFSSTDNGRTWSPAGLDFARVISLSVYGTTIVAGTIEYGIYVSHDNGTTWQPGNEGLHSTASISALAADEADVYVASAESIYKIDNGMHWSTLLPLPITTGTVTSMVALNSTLIVGTSSYGIFSLDTDNPHAVWQESTGLPAQAAAMNIFRHGTTLLAGIYKTSGSPVDSNGVFVSTDEGISWTKSDMTIPATAFTYSDGTLYAGTTEGSLFTSTDGGNHWTPAQQIPPVTGPIAALVVRGQTFFISQQHGKMLVSNDNGATWITDPSGLAGHSVHNFAQYGPVVFVATNLGVYRTETDGQTWEAANTGIENLNILHITIAGDYLYIGTVYSAVWRSLISELTTTTVTDFTPDVRQYSLHPHPLRLSSVLQLCNTCELHNATLTISAMNGRQVRSIGSIYGTSVVIERGSIAPGVYAFTLEEAGTVVVSGTLVVE